MRKFVLLAALLLSGCVSIPAMSSRSALKVALENASRKYPGADLTDARQTDLGDRWSMTFEQKADGTGGAVIVVIDKGNRRVIRSFDMRQPTGAARP